MSEYSIEYKCPCGCTLHVIKWTSKRRVITQKSCPMHLSAPEGLALARRVVEREEKGGDRVQSWAGIVAAARALIQKAGAQ